MKIDKKMKGEIGLHLLASRLFANGLIALPTMRNTKGYDMVVFNPIRNKGIGLEVKANESPKQGFPVLTSNFANCERMIEQRIMCPFVFVDISDVENARFFLVSPQPLKSILSNNFRNNKEKVRSKDPKKYEEKMDPNYKKGDLWTVKPEQLGEYEIKGNKWHFFADLLE